MLLPWLKKVCRTAFGRRRWYRRLNYRWQLPTPPQPMAREPFVLRLRPPVAERHERTRNTPYILRGRNEEMTEIARRLFDQEGSLTVVEGAPGVGKTSLMGAIGQYAENQGFAWIRLSRLDLCNLERFNQAMLRANPAAEPTNGRSLLPRAQARLDLEGGAEFEIGGARASDDIIRSPYAAISKSLRKHVHARGLCVTIDDGRGVLYNHPAESSERVIVSSILSTFNDDLQQKGLALPVHTIVGGVTGVIREVQQAVSKRLADAHYVVLDKIPHSAVHATIEDCLRTEDPVTGLAPAQFPAEFIAECAQRCYGHPLHATAIGRRLQEIGLDIASQGGSQASPADVKDARDGIATRMVGSYKTRYQNMRRRDAEVMLDLARAATQWGPRLGFRAVENLVQESGRRATERIPAEAGERVPSNWLEHLRTEGLIVTYQPTTRYPREQHAIMGDAYAEIDLPSFATYITNQRSGSGGMLSQQELEELVPPSERAIQEWTWPEAGIWHPVEQLAPHPVGNPYALEPLVPGDLPDPRHGSDHGGQPR